MSDEFYIGYNQHMPARIARVVRPTALVLVALALAVPGVLIVAQGRFSSGVFEYGRTHTVEGRVVEFPYPALEVAGGGAAAPRTYWLVGPGKHGAADLIRGLDGRVVRLEGTLIQRDADAMLQIETGGALLGDPARRVPMRDPLYAAGPVALVGEIVDSKCHLGVMKPGEGPTHRDCAVRCLLGHVPPMFVVHGERTPRRLPLVNRDGTAFSGDLSALAGRPVAVHGVLLRQGGHAFVGVAPDQIEALR